MLTINTDIDFLCQAMKKSNIQEEQKIATFDFSDYLNKDNTVNFEEFVNDCVYCINEAMKKL